MVAMGKILDNILYGVGSILKFYNHNSVPFLPKEYRLNMQDDALNIQNDGLNIQNDMRIAWEKTKEKNNDSENT